MTLIYLQDETEACYTMANRRPLIQKQHGGTEYTVSHTNLALADGQDVTVVITSGAYALVSKICSSCSVNWFAKV